MNVCVGKSYHIKDDFFLLVKDEKLMANKEGCNYRPHFFCFEDSQTQGIYWAIPQSTRVAPPKKKSLSKTGCEGNTFQKEIPSEDNF